MFDWLFGKKEKVEEKIEEPVVYKMPKDEMFEAISTMGMIKDLEDSNEFDEKILVVEDVEYSHYLYEDLLEGLQTYNCDRVTNKDVISSYGPYAGYSAIKYIIANPNKIKFALLDITLGTPLRFNEDNYILLNGIDVAEVLMKYNKDIKNPNMSMVLLGKDNSSIRDYMIQCKDHLGMNLEDLYVFKNGDNMLESIRKAVDENSCKTSNNKI